MSGFTANTKMSKSDKETTYGNIDCIESEYVNVSAKPKTDFDLYASTGLKYIECVYMCVLSNFPYYYRHHVLT